MKVNEILGKEQEHLNEFALGISDEYTEEVARAVIEAEAGPWSQPMTAEQLLKSMGIPY